MILRFLLVSAALFVLIGGLRAQPVQAMMDHPLSELRTDGFRPGKSSAISETLRVLVAMVEFTPDNEPRTTGDGTFDLSQPTRTLIDPPPHNMAYVQEHTTFLENYFRKASGGKLIIVSTVLDSVYRLQHPMAYYSPPKSSTTNAELGNLIVDAWHAVDSLTPGVQFQRYSVFMIFHAGVGRDIDLASKLGVDPGPFDIPSVYLGLPGLRKIFGPAFAGVPVQNGTFSIQNSLIIPETESRRVSNGISSSLLELGINGLLAASIGSHLGLPDLFNTKNGRSGIGRFGLMDGQAIFSWYGVFPPEPMAWEKYFLGWIDPIIVPPGSATYELPAAALNPSADTVYRVPISAKEYFLVENRNRDAHRDGSIITIVRNDSTIQRTYPRDTPYFSAFNQDSIYGVVTDVDEFDWSLPGHTNTTTGEFFDGGILIWHIDENVIEANYANDAVNADANHRGVNLLEADGSQDIGQSYDLISPGFGSEEGRFLDYWYHGNTSTPRILSNEFTPNSLPNSLSNDFANSHVYMNNFSDRGPRMSLTIRLGDDQVKPLPGFPRNLRSSPGMSSVLPADLDGDGISEFVVAITGKASNGDSIPLADGAILAFRQNGSSFFNSTDSSGRFISDNSYSFDPPIAFDFNGDGKDDIATVRHPTSPNYTTADLRIFSPMDNNSDGNPEVLWGTRYGIASSGNILPYHIVKSDSAVVWGGTGRHLLLVNDTTRVHSSGSNYSALAWEGKGERFYGYDFYNGIEKFDSTPEPLGRTGLPSVLSGSPAIGDLDGDGKVEIVVLSRNGYVYVLDTAGAAYRKFPYPGGVSISSSPAIGDLNNDGRKEIVWTAGTEIFAVNAAGALVDNFPINVRTSHPLTCSPVLADIDGDGHVDVLVVTREGKLCAYRTDGKMIPGFPLQLGGDVLTSVTLFRTSTGYVGVAAACEDHYLYAWELSGRYDSTLHPWPMYLHDIRHSGYEGTPGKFPVPGNFFPAARAYNWPNPVTSSDGYKTHIRYFVATDAHVDVKIFDMAGDLVAELQGNGIGGLDNELDWDVTNIQSGVYFGHIEAQGTNASGNAVIKIAVVK